jgi:hypothetical protein
MAQSKVGRFSFEQVLIAWETYKYFGFRASYLPSFKHILMRKTMKLDVLILGNSHTYLHYMPQMLVGLVKVESRGFDRQVDQSIGEGVNLEWHWDSDLSRRKMRTKKWDYIVLQDRSGGPLKGSDLGLASRPQYIFS